MNKNKKSGSVLLTILGVVAAIVSVMATIMGIITRKNMKKMEENEDQNNTMHTVLFNNLIVETDRDIDNAYLTCIFGNMDVNIEYPAKENLHLDIFNLFGNINIKIPNGVNVLYDADDFYANLDSDLEDIDDEEAPIIMISGKNSLGNVVLRRAEEEIYRVDNYFQIH